MVHERNKNASTAARVLGMPLPNRPHAVLLAAHEDDPAAMVDGMKDSLRETLSIGHSLILYFDAVSEPLRNVTIIVCT